MFFLQNENTVRCINDFASYFFVISIKNHVYWSMFMSNTLSVHHMREKQILVHLIRQTQIGLRPRQIVAMLHFCPIELKFGEMMCF